MSYGNFVRAFKEFGAVGTFKKLYQQRTLKFGSLVGTDRYGNKYFENTEDYHHGQHRWVEYVGNPSFYEADPSTVPAEWHGWLHHTTDTPPTDTTVGDTHQHKPAALLHHSDATFKRNLGWMSGEDHGSNLSHHRPRGFDTNNGLQGGMAASALNEERFWTQPGHPLDPRYKAFKIKSTRPWTLKDTPASAERKQKLNAYRKGELSAADVADLLEEGDAGTFASGASVQLTAEEEAWVRSNGFDEEDDYEDLQSRVTMLQQIVYEFAAVDGAETKDALAAAQVELAEASAQWEMVQGIKAKYAAADAQ